MKNLLILPALVASLAAFAQVEDPATAPAEMEDVEESTDYGTDFGADAEGWIAKHDGVEGGEDV